MPMIEYGSPDGDHKMYEPLKQEEEPDDGGSDSNRQANNMFGTLKSRDSVVYSGNNAVDAKKVLDRLKGLIRSGGEDFESNYDVSSQNINEGMFTVSRKNKNEQTPDDNEMLDKAA